jgi:hypothetical protein
MSGKASLPVGWLMRRPARPASSGAQFQPNTSESCGKSACRVSVLAITQMAREMTGSSVIEHP